MFNILKSKFKTKDACVKCITYPICKNRIVSEFKLRIDELKQIYQIYTKGHMETFINKQIQEDIYRTAIIIIYNLYRHCHYIKKYHGFVISSTDIYKGITEDLIRIIQLIQSFNLEESNKDIETYMINIRKDIVEESNKHSYKKSILESNEYEIIT